MLSEQVLEDLARDAPLQQMLVETAWPGLSVESKLQVIHSVQGNRPGGTETWLMELCIDDPAPIVRYWAARHYSFPPAKDKVFPEQFANLIKPRPENEKLLRAKAEADTNGLVRSCTSEDPWEASDVLSRLVFARNAGTVHIVKGLSKALDAGLSDDDLSNAFREVLAKPEVQADLRFKGMYNDGDTAYYEGQVVKEGWALARRAGPRLQSLLARALPTDRGLYRVAPTDLATMPAKVLSSLAYRRDKSKEISEALELVLKHPEKYEESVIQDINKGLEFTAEYGDENSKAKSSIDRGQETLDQVLALQAQVQELTERLEALGQLASAKRGWFS